MASVEVEYDFCVLKGDENIEYKAEDKLNFENLEVVIPDDITDEDLEAVESQQILLDSIPEPKFVDEDLIDAVTTDLSLQETPRPFHCPSCGKQYKYQGHYNRHIRELCGGPGKSGKKKSTKELPSIKKKQAKKSTSGSVNPMDHEFIEDSETFLLSALISSKEDPFNNMKIQGIDTPGNKVAKVATELIEFFAENKTALVQAGNSLVSVIVDIFSETNFKLPSSRENMWGRLMTVVKFEYKNTALYTIAKEKFDVGDTVFCSLYYSLCANILNAVVKKVNDSSTNTDTKTVNLDISGKEKQVIYYVAGYIVFSLSKHYETIFRKKKTDKVLMATVGFLKSLTTCDEEISGNSFMEYVQKWTKSVSRGYLIEVHVDMFNFIEAVEQSARKILNVQFIRKYKQEDLRESIDEKIHENTDVANAWLTLTRNCPNEELIIFLKEQMLSKWVDIRANSFVNSYILVIKRKLFEKKQQKKLSSSSEPALRKTLCS